jgi:hypothetical protein
MEVERSVSRLAGARRPLGGALRRRNQRRSRYARWQARIQRRLVGKRERWERIGGGHCGGSVTRLAPARHAVVSRLIGRPRANGRLLVLRTADRKCRRGRLLRCAHHRASTQAWQERGNQGVVSTAAKTPHREKRGEAASSADKTRGLAHWCAETMSRGAAAQPRVRRVMWPGDSFILG